MNDADHWIVHWTRVVNNIELPHDKQASKWTPPGYVQAHGRETPAREGFDYTNSQLQGEDLNMLEERVRRRARRP
jgi:hypothetical protein